MHTDVHSFEIFWTAFSRELRPLRLGRACLSLALLTRRSGRLRWRWALAAVALATGKLLGGTLDEDVDARGSCGRPPGIAPRPTDRTSDAPDVPTLATGEPGAAEAARARPGPEAAWAAWL